MWVRVSAAVTRVRRACPRRAQSHLHTAHLAGPRASRARARAPTQPLSAGGGAAAPTPQPRGVVDRWT
jgi:hypothetical protein